MVLQKLPYSVLSIGGSLLLALAWPFIGSFTYVIFIAWVPMLLLEDHIFRKNYRPRKFFYQSFLFFLLFNVWCTWWIYYASFWGMIMAVVFNAVLMVFPLWLFHVTKRRVGVKEGYIAFVLNWIAFEYLHTFWELSWPWLTMGNVFANDVKLIQWYEITGVSGGTLWVLVVNLVTFFIIRDKWWNASRKMFEQKSRLALLAILLILPVCSSLISYYGYQEQPAPIDVVVVQPNIDPYNDKFGGLSQHEQLNVFFDLALTKMDDKVDFLIGPETQLAFPVEENNFETSPPVTQIQYFISSYPNLRFISGMSSYRIFEENEKPDNAKPLDAPGLYYDHYNSAFQLSNRDSSLVYHKMKLVLGVEKIPFSKLFPFLENFALELGGSSGSMGMEKSPKNFISIINDKQIIAPAICYESIYSEHISHFVLKGATAIFIITNDGWWEDTPGYKQHMAYARLRAIENRRSIARCANTGISCFINQRGDVIEKSKWWEKAVLRQKINANEELTYYSKNGDFIGRSALFIAALLVFYTITRWIMGKTSSRKEV